MPYGLHLVDEGFPVRDFPADCPILELFKPLPFEHISSPRFGIKALRVFQHKSGFDLASLLGSAQLVRVLASGHSPHLPFNPFIAIKLYPVVLIIARKNRILGKLVT